MDYERVLADLESLKEVIEEYNPIKYESSDRKKEVHTELVTLYGRVADVVEKFEGKAKIPVPPGGKAPSYYPNFIEAGYLSGRTFHSHQGYTQLLKVIGKVRTATAQENNHPPRSASVADVSRVLSRFRECSQYIQTVPDDERAVQDIVWIMLRSHFDRLDRETALPKLGMKSYRPDFGIPELGLLIEVKYIGPSTDPKRIQDEILADLPAYLTSQSAYDSLLVFVYDQAHKLRDPAPLIRDIGGIDGVAEVIVVPGIG